MHKFLIVTFTVDSEKISTEDQQEYWSGVGMLPYLVKHSCPNLANATREILKVNDGANPAAYKELLHVIRYDLDMNKLGPKIECTGNSNKPWEMICFRDYNYAGDPVIRRSISGFILYVSDALVSW